MTPQIQEAFDKKYEEIGEDIWHDIGNDRIFYFGWKACEAASERNLEQQLDVAREFCRQSQIENKKLKAATTECYEKNLDLNLENFELKAKTEHLQFLLDSVMLEYCPDEMTEEQMENWKRHQKKVDITTSVDTADPNYYKSDTYKNNIKYSADMIK